MKRILYILIINFIFSSCSLGKKITEQEVYDSLFSNEFTKTYPIKLETGKADGIKYIEYENTKSIIMIRVDSVLKYAERKCNEDNLCERKKENLEELILLLNNNKENDFYLIESNIRPETYKEYKLPKPKEYKKTYIEPYGYNIVIDTTNKYKIEFFKNWMLDDLLIQGGNLVMDKSQKIYVDTILYRVTDFKDGHGGEYFTFKNNKIFYTAKIYTDVIWPDFDCMSKEEIEKW